VTSHLPNNRTGLIRGEDAFCEWATVRQEGSDDDDDDDANTGIQAQALAQDYANQPHPDLLPDLFNPIVQRQRRKEKAVCPPKKGKAKISSTLLILGGYQPEANYTVKVKVTEEGAEGRTIFDLWTEFELKYRDGYLVM